MRTLLVTESIALGAVRKLTEDREGELKSYFPSFFVAYERHFPPVPNVEAARQQLRKISETLIDADEDIREEYRRIVVTGRSFAPPIRDRESTVMLKIGSHGIFNALWELCDLTGSGCDIDVLTIPLRQETIEVCDYVDLDPYTADSAGSLLIASPEGVQLAAELAEAGIQTTVIGCLNDRKARTIRCREHLRYLDRPRFRTEYTIEADR